MSFIYDEVHVPHSLAKTQRLELLNQLGEKGWEAYAHETTRSGHLFFLKSMSNDSQQVTLSLSAPQVLDRSRSLGQVVLAWRSYRDLTLEQLADRAGLRVSISGIHKIETGATMRPRQRTLISLAKGLEISLDCLLGHEMPPP